MATALTSLQHQHQSQQLTFTTPIPPQSPRNTSPVQENFCKECGLAFESQTSLEVHLSYHRSNLISRWATPAPPPPPPSDMESSKFQKSDIHPPPPPSGSGYYDPQYHHPEYHQDQDQFHRHQYPPPPPLNSGGYEAPHRLAKHPSAGGGGAPPEEILDLDSNKVHIYNLPHQQLQYFPTNSFYRPYLLTQPTQQSPHQNLPPPFSQDQHHHHYRTGSPQPRRSPMINYEFQGHHHGYVGQSGVVGPPQETYQAGALQPVGGGGPPSQNPNFRGNFPPKSFSEESRSPEPMMSSPGLLMTTERTKKGKKSKENGSLMMNDVNDDSNSPVPPKTKGWKGGECKRPKTYNCTACNKWFTSSGHLKRHYGTTLHKNSLRQQGGNPDDDPVVAPSGKKTKAGGHAQGPKRNSNEDPNNGGGNDLTHDDQDNKPDDLPRPMVTSPSPNVNGTSTSAGPSSHRLDFGHHLSPPPPPPPPPASHNAPTYLHVYHNGLQAPPPVSQPYMGMGMGGQFHPVGYDPPNVYTVSYNSSYPPGLMGSEPPLPPFGTVLSPYDQQFGHHGVYMHHPPPGSGSPPYDTESGIHSNSTSDGNDLKNGESPEAPRSSSTSGLETSDDACSDASASLGFSSPSGVDEPDVVTTVSTVSSTVTSPSAMTSASPAAQVLKCPDCEKTFNRSCYLTQHTKSSHSGGKPFKCPTCGKRFLEEPLLSDHVAKHGDNKPYKCALCPKQFNHKTDLRRHLCLHTGEKPYACALCGKGFIRKDHMTKHAETHRKVKGQSN